MADPAAATVAQSVVQTSGVAAATLTDMLGLPLATAGDTDAARDAVLASFIASRVEAMTAEGDLRGKGRVLHDSRLLHASFSGRNRDFALVPAGEQLAFVTFRNDAIADVVVDHLVQALRQPGS